MRILIFNWRDLKNPQAGGAELYLNEQAKIWTKKGHKVSWICGGFKNCKKREIIDGIEFIRIGNSFSLYFLAPLMYLKIRKNFDIIIDAENGIPFFTPLFAKKKKILIIHHIHKDVWKKEKKFPLSLIGYFLEMKLMPLVYKNVRIITVSYSSNEEIKKLFKKEAEIIYNGVNLNKYIPGKKAKNPEIVFIGRLKKYKSVDILLKALSLLKKENLTTYILGSGDDEKRLKKITRELKLKNVIFKGFIDEEEKIKRLQKAWIVINPSMIEGWSITNIEANACGTVVIGSNVNGIKDSIINNKTGLLFEYGNYKELAGKIKLLIENKKLRKKLEKNAIKWAKNFSWKKSANKFLEIMKKI
ncbi:MAG: glycosyltransferase family 4 protein [Candidatus Pacearchaeota archaeon]